MKNNRQYEIAWQGLKSGIHVYTFDIDDRFMDQFGIDNDLRDWIAKVTLTFDKKSSFFLLHFDIDGQVKAACDRCGDDLNIRLWDEFDLVIKLTDDETLDSNNEDDVVFIQRSETVIDISRWLYEFVMLSIPLQKVHEELPSGGSGCNPDALKLLDKLTPENQTRPDPIWKGLEAIIKEVK